MIPSAASFLRLHLARLAVFLGLALSAFAAPPAWDLPRQPLPDALQAFARQSGWQVLFSPQELDGVSGNPVQGEHEPLAALELLLAGTRFEGVATGGQRVVVRARPLSRLSGLVLAGEPTGPLAGAAVELEGTGISAVTGRNGRFELPRVPAGTHALTVRADGFVPYRLGGVEVGAGLRLELKAITLRREGEPAADGDNGGVADRRPLLQLENMVVVPSRYGVADSLSVAAATVTHEDLELLPQLGEDLYRAIGRMPGLATLDYSAKFWVRGAPNEQVLARLDGLTLLEPYHVKELDGALAIIDLETVDRVDLISGGFTAEYGDRTAGVLQMETTTHREARPHTTLGLSLTGVRATQRGATADGRGSWLLSARMGYPDIAVETTNRDGGKLRIRYHDMFGKFEYAPVAGHVLGFHVLYASDELKLRETNGRNLTNSYGNTHAWLRWRADLPGGLKGETVLAHSQLDWRRRGEGELDDGLPYTLDEDRDLALTVLRSDWSQPAGERHLLRGGFEFQRGEANYDYHRLRSFWAIREGVPVVVQPTLDREFTADGMNNGGYATWRFQPRDRLTLEPGVRYDWSDYGPANGGFSPRFNAVLDLGRTTIRGAWGLYRQQQGLHEINFVDGESRVHPAEEAEQRVLSVETALPRGLGFRAEVYQRITRRPRPHGENLVESVDALAELLADRRFLRPTQAEAEGVELSLQSRGRKQLDWSASYALARTVETIDGRKVPRNRDQRHTVQADLVWRPNPRWQFSAGWLFHTGWPTSAETFGITTLANGDQVFARTYGPYHAERLPAYHRLDLRVTRVFKLKRGTLRVFADVFNAYDQDNAVQYNVNPEYSNGVVTNHRSEETLLPILPSVGLIWDF